MSESRSRRMPPGEEHPFIVLRENRLAYTAVSRLLDPKSAGERPLVTLFGPSGCGKSHLLKQLARQAVRQHGEFQIVSLTAAQFAEDAQTAAQEIPAPRPSSRMAKRDPSRHGVLEFTDRFRQADLFICEDVQAIVKRREAQGTLVAVIDDLRAHQRRVVLTCSRAPGEAGFSARLVNRCHGGVSVEIEPYGRHSRRQLVELFAAEMEVALPAEAVRQLTADGRRSARELQSLVRQLREQSRQRRRRVDAAIVSEVLHHHADPHQLSLSQIALAVADEFDISVKNMRTSKRLRSITDARGAAMFLTKAFTDATYEEIGAYFSRNHSTVIHACRRVQRKLGEDTNLACRLANACERLNRKLPSLQEADEMKE